MLQLSAARRLKLVSANGLRLAIASARSAPVFDILDGLRIVSDSMVEMMCARM